VKSKWVAIAAACVSSAWLMPHALAQTQTPYDTVSGTYAQFVEREVLPLVEQRAGVKLTKDPDGRATMGLSSSGTAAFTMAWFHPELYRRVLAYSPTMVNQQWPWNPALRGGA